MRVFLLSHITNYWTPLYAVALRDRGHDVVVASFDGGVIDGVRTVSVGKQPWQGHKSGHVTRALRVRRLIDECQPDVVFATYVISNGLTAALARRRPLVVSAHGYDLLVDSAYSGLVLHARKALLGWICRQADAVHVVSEEMVDATRALGIAAERIHNIPVGIRLARFPRRNEHGPAQLLLAEGQTARSGSEHAPHILCTRRHEPIYDNETFIDALGLLAKAGHSFRASLVGPGPLTEAYRARAERLGLAGRVQIAGGVPYDQIPQLLAESDVFVSASRVDGTSSALLEAMAVGLVPVVSNIAANRAWVADGDNGLLFPCGDAPVLANALARAIGDTALISRALERNRNRVEQLGNLDVNLGRLETLLRQVAERR